MKIKFYPASNEVPRSILSFELSNNCIELHFISFRDWKRSEWFLAKRGNSFGLKTPVFGIRADFGSAS